MKTPKIQRLTALLFTGLSLVSFAPSFMARAEETAPLPPEPSRAATGAEVAAPAVPLPQPTPLKLSPGAAGIAKLAQGGLDESVMVAYIGTVDGKFNLGSDQIVYLNDLGISSAVIQAMIQRDASIDAAAIAAANPPPSVMPPVEPPIDPNLTTAPPPPFVDETSIATDPDAGLDTVISDSDYFYNSLSPYGAWVLVPGCGLCWRPTVCLGNRDWQPYADRGRWLYSDSGWYWQSDYSWGWAAFHYGRWFEDPRTGWCWQPNRTWGPAWVSWQRSGDYCGWAPLAPARYIPRGGSTDANYPVAGNFNHGLNAGHYKFVAVAHLSEYNPMRYAAIGDQARAISDNATVMNHATVKNNRGVNPGVDPREVAAASRMEVRRAEIVETVRPANIFQGEHLTKQGNSLVIVRPTLPEPVRHGVTTQSIPARASRSPLYFKGSSINSPAETYPRGSLVVVGQKTALRAGVNPTPVAYYASANVPTLASQPTRPVESFTFKPYFNPAVSRSDESLPTRQEPVVIGGRYTVAQHLMAAEPSHFHSGSRPESTHEASQPVAAATTTHMNVSVAHATTVSSGATSSSHSSGSSSSSSSSSGSSSGHR